MRNVSLWSIIITASSLLTPLDGWAQSTALTLGAKPAEVEARFGEPFMNLGSVMKFEPCPGSEEFEGKWSLIFMTVVPETPDGEIVVGGILTAIQRSTCGTETLDKAAAKQEFAELLPIDATLNREFRTEDGRHAWEYHSATLASLFKASDFVGCDEEGRVMPAVPGTFTCTLAEDGSNWFLALGTCL